MPGVRDGCESIAVGDCDLDDLVILVLDDEDSDGWFAGGAAGTSITIILAVDYAG